MRLKQEQEELEKLEVFIGDMLPESLKRLDGEPIKAVGAMGMRLAANDGEISRLQKTLDAINASGTGSEALTKINEIVQRWHTGGVARAIESAPARMAEIGDLLNARAASLVAESRAMDKAEADPVPFGENGTCLTCGESGDKHNAFDYAMGKHAFRPKQVTAEPELELGDTRGPIEEARDPLHEEEETRLDDSDTGAGYEGQGSN